MTAPSLTLGAFLLSFSPSLSLLFTIILPKPQLVILAVCAAFAYLLSAFGSSLFWLVLNAIFNFTGNYNNNDNGGVGSGVSSIGALLSLTIPSIFIQCIVRMAFVTLYFRVEDVIRNSVRRHEDENNVASGNTTAAGGNTTNNGGNSGGNNTAGGDEHAETNALQLQLNDISCSLASGTGYALLHTLFLYGTLLASESGESNNYYGNIGTSGEYYGGGGGSTGHGGTLYQSSCSMMPSVINGALISMMFSVLDVVWMMLTFYGMRRRLVVVQQQGQQQPRELQTCMRKILHFVMDSFSFLRDTCTFWKGMEDTPQGGNAALGLVLVSHLMASLVIGLPNSIMIEDGCRVSLPCLGGVVVFVMVFAMKGLKGHFLPVDQRSRIEEMRMMMMGSGGGDYHVD
jgi:hypothetical protein